MTYLFINATTLIDTTQISAIEAVVPTPGLQRIGVGESSTVVLHNGREYPCPLPLRRLPPG